MFNQNRHYWTPPKWLSSSAVFPLDGSPPMICRHFLWTSGGRAAMRNEPRVWPEVGMPGRAAREQCLWGRHRWWDSKTKYKKYLLLSTLLQLYRFIIAICHLRVKKRRRHSCKLSIYRYIPVYTNCTNTQQQQQQKEEERKKRSITMTLTLWSREMIFCFFFYLPRPSHFHGMNKVYCYCCFYSISSRTDAF